MRGASRLALSLAAMAAWLALPDSARARSQPQSYGSCSPRPTKQMLAVQSTASATNQKAYRKALKRAGIKLLRKRPRLLHKRDFRNVKRFRVGQVLRRGRYRRLVVGLGSRHRPNDSYLRLATDAKGNLWAVRRLTKRRKHTTYRICGCRPGSRGRGIRFVPSYWGVPLPPGKTFKGTKTIRYPVDRVLFVHVGRHCHNKP